MLCRGARIARAALKESPEGYASRHGSADEESRLGPSKLGCGEHKLLNAPICEIIRKPLNLRCGLAYGLSGARGLVFELAGRAAHRAREALDGVNALALLILGGLPEFVGSFSR